MNTRQNDYNGMAEIKELLGMFKAKRLDDQTRRPFEKQMARYQQDEQQRQRGKQWERKTLIEDEE